MPPSEHVTACWQVDLGCPYLRAWLGHHRAPRVQRTSIISQDICKNIWTTNVLSRRSITHHSAPDNVLATMYFTIDKNTATPIYLSVLLLFCISFLLEGERHFCLEAVWDEVKRTWNVSTTTYPVMHVIWTFMLYLTGFHLTAATE